MPPAYIPVLLLPSHHEHAQLARLGFKLRPPKCEHQILHIATVLHVCCVLVVCEHAYVTGMSQRFQNCAQIRFKICNGSLRYE